MITKRLNLFLDGPSFCYKLIITSYESVKIIKVSKQKKYGFLLLGSLYWKDRIGGEFINLI